MAYELCNSYGNPLINERNVIRFRNRVLAYGVGVTTIGIAGGASALPLLGFGTGGVVAGSWAAAWQSSLGLVSAGSAFALLQSLGATGIGIVLFGTIGGVTGGGAAGLIARHASLFGWCECQNGPPPLLPAPIDNNVSEND